MSMQSASMFLVQPTRRVAIMTLVALAISGCAGQRSHEMLAATGSAEIEATHSILIATTRERSQDPALVYDGARGSALTFARADVTVPAVHVTGALERPKGRQPLDPARHFAATRVGLFHDEGAFETGLSERLASSNGRALVFIHGYNTPFDAAVFRATQIVHDSGYAGTPVLFSWASAGRTIDYIYDNNSATIARDGLEHTLRMLADNGASRIDIVAHSMGNWVTMEALRQLAITDDRDIGGRLGDVVLASPDIDVDVFRSQLQRIGKPDRPFFVLLSGDDRALRVSSLLAGNRPRVGDYLESGNLAELGVIVVDVTKVGAGDSMNHAKFADNPLLVRMLGERLRDDDQLGARTSDVSSRIETLGRGLGATLGSAAEIVITTPLEVISVAVGG
jgi:esterase/lipase superfamily enzyme